MLSKTAGMAVIASVLALTSSAQDYSKDAYGETIKSSGFTPDPHAVNVQAGGSKQASGVMSGCNGFISDRPDYRFNYTSGSLPLCFFANSGADAMLLINQPNGRGHCNDDGGFNLNPLIKSSRPVSGQYDIRVGTVQQAPLRRSTLYVSELHTE